MKARAVTKEKLGFEARVREVIVGNGSFELWPPRAGLTRAILGIKTSP